MADYGLGALPSVPDERDWDIELAYSLVGASPLVTVPTSYAVPAPLPPVLDQDGTPQCVAYSTSYLKAWLDLRDQGAFNFDEAKFFVQIGGDPVYGASTRTALDRMLRYGYPVVNTGDEAAHRIASYYTIPLDQVSLQSAIYTFGPIEMSWPWFQSWFRPDVNGVLPAPNYTVGGHAILGVGWDSRGLRLRNSWGTDWGIRGDAFMPWSYLRWAWEAWKTLDVVVPPPARWSVRIAANTLVRIATLNAAKTCIAGWTTYQWGSRSSSAACAAPVIKPGCSSGQATIIRVTNGLFAGKWLRVGNGVSVVRY